MKKFILSNLLVLLVLSNSFAQFEKKHALPTGGFGEEEPISTEENNDLFPRESRVMEDGPGPPPTGGTTSGGGTPIPFDGGASALIALGCGLVAKKFYKKNPK